MRGFGIIEPTVSVGWIEKEMPVAGPYEAVLEPVVLCPCTSDVDTAAENKNGPIAEQILELTGGQQLLPIYTNESLSFVAHKKVTGGLCPGGRRRLERLMGIVKSGRLPVEKLISHKCYGFDAIEDAFNLMAGKSSDIVKPIVYMDK